MENNSPLDDANAVDLQKRLAAVESDNATIREEFNVQRAKLKELFLQKEAECRKLGEQLVVLRKELDETKSQVVVAEYKRETDAQSQDRKAQEEIASLQHLVQETVEESSFLKSEIDRLTAENDRLRNGLSQPPSSISPQPHESSTTSFAPVLSHVKKTLVRKLGGDSSASNENLEDSMRKVNKYAQEDAEVLRSLVIPLEGEIRALKEKLRSADEEIQQLRNTGASSGISGATSSSALVGMLNESRTVQSDITVESATPDTTIDSDQRDCRDCENYSSQLAEIRSEKEKLSEDIKRFNEELSREAELRRDLEKKWQEKRDKYNEHVQQLSQKVNSNENELAALQRHYSSFKEEVNEKFQKMTNERQMVQKHLDKLQDDNNILAGQYMASSEEIQNQPIDLPNTVEELQEALLQSHQNLIEVRISSEFAQRECSKMTDEVQILRDQLQASWAERQSNKRDLVARIEQLEAHLKAQESERLALLNLKHESEKKEKDREKEIKDLRGQIIELTESKEKIERQNEELRIKVSVLQEELGHGEAVQKDFVLLSQSLQVELEKIRSADTHIRWQDDDDVDECRNCRATFTVTRRKLHCRHCGSIYCEKCLSKTVITGRSNKKARVCDVCHTLLVRDTAPYFSQAPPQSPH